MSDQVQRPYSAYSEHIGYELTVCKKGHAEVVLKVAPQHLNRAHIPHGGVLATLLDAASGFAIAFADGPQTVKPAVTLTLNIMYLGQAKLGDTLTAVGHHVGGGRTVAYATAEITTQDGLAVARGEAVFRYLGDRRPPGVGKR